MSGFIKEKCRYIIIALVFIALLVILISTFNKKNPLLQYNISQGSVIETIDTPGSGSYEYKYIWIKCTEEEIASLKKEEYIEFLEQVVEHFSDEIGRCFIEFSDTNMGVLYMNGDSSKGYYVNCTVGNYTVTPEDPRCTIEGIVMWDGVNLTYSPSTTEQRLMDVVSTSLPEKYHIY